MGQSAVKRPHSRACGWKQHDHGPDCHANCPTCGGRALGPVFAKGHADECSHHQGGACTCQLQMHDRIGRLCTIPDCPLPHDPAPLAAPPTEMGYYYNEGSSAQLIYYLDGNGQWYSSFGNGFGPGQWIACAWGYVEQTTSAYPLKKVG